MAVETFPTPKRILCIIAGSNADLHYPDAAQSDKLFSLSFDALSKATLAECAPDLVVFPLFSGTTDATEILTVLNGFGYRGRCLVLCQSLPRPKLIEAELRSYAGDMKVELMVSP
jgi:hypothetical protein